MRFSQIKQNVFGKLVRLIFGRYNSLDDFNKSAFSARFGFPKLANDSPQVSDEFLSVDDLSRVACFERVPGELPSNDPFGP